MPLACRKAAKCACGRMQERAQRCSSCSRAELACSSADPISTDVMSAEHSPVAPSFAQALRFWLKLGFVSFGGPAGQIAVMHRELVEQKRWISEQRFLHALNYCMLLPGPEAQQLATYIGWL